MPKYFCGLSDSMEACKLSYYDSSETEAVAMGCLVTRSCAVLFLSY